MKDVFKIHQDLGRYFKENHYKNALQLIRNDVVLEVPVQLSHETYQKTFYLDMLIANGAIIEFKVADSLVKAHQAQLFNYLLMTQLQQGLLVNLGSDKVEKQFVNNTIPNHERYKFRESLFDWDEGVEGAKNFRQLLNSLLADWGGFLANSIYEDVLISLLGGADIIKSPAEVRIYNADIGTVNVNLVADNVAFRVTGFYSDSALSNFEINIRRFISHLKIDWLLWANIGRNVVQYRCIKKDNANNR